MIPINEKEEKDIDNIGKHTLIFHRGDKSFTVSMKDIYCYGEVDFTDDDIMNQIDNFGFLNYLEDMGIHIYARYDYQTHTCRSPKKHCLWSETWSPAKLTQMAHGYLGKPKRILLFNETIDDTIQKKYSRKTSILEYYL